MFKEGFENLERYTRELEAVKNYAQVKEDRDSLAKEAGQLKGKLGHLEAQLKSEVRKKEELSLRLDKSEAAVKELSTKLDEVAKELSSLQNLSVKLPEGSVLSLDEMKAQFLKVEEDEIEGRAKARLGELEKELHSQMPALVYQRLIEIIKHPGLPPEIEEVINSHAKKITDDSLRDMDKWPDWFKEYYSNEVKESVNWGLNSEFEKRVQAEAERRLDALKAGQWRDYTAHKARGLAVDLKGLVSQLQGTWRFSCDRCGRRLAIEMGPSQIGALLGGGVVDVVCSVCSDPAPFPFILSTIPHKVSSLSLGELLQVYMGKPPSG